MSKQENDYAVVVGVNHYPQYQTLEGAIDDAEDVVRWLALEPNGGGLDEANVKKVVSDGVCPVQRDVDMAFQAIYDAVRKKGHGRRLYFFFGGHGFARGPEDVALCLLWWSKTFRSFAISSGAYREDIRNRGCFDEVVLWLDCCRTREVAAVGMPPLNPWPAVGAGAGRTRTFLAYATEYQHPASEAGAPGGLVRGHFTRALLAGLRGGAARPQGGVASRDLKAYVERETPRIAQAAQHEAQRPEVNDGLAEGAVFGSAAPTANVEIEFAPSRGGEIVLEGPDLEVVRSGPVSTGPWQLTLHKGLHRLREVETGDFVDLPFRPGAERMYVRF